MIAALTVSLLASSHSHPRPIFAFNLNGKVISPTEVSWRPGTKVIPVPGGVGLEFDGVSSGLMVRDHITFAI